MAALEFLYFSVTLALASYKLVSYEKESIAYIRLNTIL